MAVKLAFTVTTPDYATMTDAEKVDALRRIINEAEQLRTMAEEAGEGMLAFLLENVLHEARAILIGLGHEVAPPNVVLPFARRPDRSH